MANNVCPQCKQPNKTDWIHDRKTDRFICRSCSSENYQGKKDFPGSIYQCVSKPGSCKFEWCCGPECACARKEGTGTEEEKADIKKAKQMQAKWRRLVGVRKEKA